MISLAFSKLGLFSIVTENMGHASRWGASSPVWNAICLEPGCWRNRVAQLRPCVRETGLGIVSSAGMPWYARVQFRRCRGEDQRTAIPPKMRTPPIHLGTGGVREEYGWTGKPRRQPIYVAMSLSSSSARTLTLL